MPNHIHGIVWINTDYILENVDIVAATGRSPLQNGLPPKSLSSFIAGYKSAVTKRINQIRQTQCIPVWQRNYYEHIIRNEYDLNKIREYISLIFQSTGHQMIYIIKQRKR